MVTSMGLVGRVLFFGLCKNALFFGPESRYQMEKVMMDVTQQDGNQGKRKEALNKRIEMEAFCGYLADTEANVEGNRQRIAFKKKEKRVVRVPAKKRTLRLRKRQKYMTMGLHDCSWIQRILSSTPYKYNTTSDDITDIDDLLILSTANSDRKRRSKPSTDVRVDHRKVLVPDLALLHVKPTGVACDGKDIEIPALIKMAKALVSEYHDLRALYRRYSPHYME